MITDEMSQGTELASEPPKYPSPISHSRYLKSLLIHGPLVLSLFGLYSIFTTQGIPS